MGRGVAALALIAFIKFFQTGWHHGFILIFFIYKSMPREQVSRVLHICILLFWMVKMFKQIKTLKCVNDGGPCALSGHSTTACYMLDVCQMRCAQVFTKVLYKTIRSEVVCKLYIYCYKICNGVH